MQEKAERLENWRTIILKALKVEKRDNQKIFFVFFVVLKGTVREKSRGGKRDREKRDRAK